MKHYLKLVGIISILILSGCSATGKYSNPVVETNSSIVKNDKAAIVFLRASSFGGAITSPLVKVDDNGKSEIVGILGPKEKMVEYVEPGEHMFMIIGENADFMKAHVEAGKVYYSIIRPRMGVWKARFALTPFKQISESKDFDVNGEKLKKWLKESSMTEPNEQVFAWHSSKSGELLDMFNEYSPIWHNKDQSKRDSVTLQVDDGLPKAIQ